MNTHSTFLKTLDKTDRKIRQLQEQSSYVRYHYESGDLKEAYENALKLEEISERTVLLTRALPAYTGNPKAQIETDNLIRLCMPIDVGFTVEGWFCLRIPALLPKKRSGSADYIRYSLYMVMRDFFAKAAPIKYTDCVLIFRHVYDRARPERAKRDHDNIEVNMVSDIVALYVMPDDGPDYCSHFYCSAEGNEDRTEVYVVPQNEFSHWLEAEKNMSDKGVKLYENRLV